MAVNKKRLSLVDYMKALCVVFVIITHGDFLCPEMLDKEGLFYLLAVNKAVPVFMFLSGFVYALGGGKRNLDEEYSVKKMLPRFLRLTVPTLIAYLFYVLISIISKDGFGFYDLVRDFLVADYGSGSYYYHIMVQFVILAPLMYWIVYKYKGMGVVLIGIINLLYEAVWGFLPLPDRLYRVLVLRYLLAIAFGIYFALYRERIKPRAVFVWAFVGLCYILLPYFTGYEYKIFSVSPWNSSAMMSVFYVAAVMCVIFKIFGEVAAKGRIGKTVAFVGKASYHIMYVQMIYFIVRPAIDFHIYDITTLPIFLQFIVDIVVCVVVGMVFCVVDNKLFGKFYKSFK